jgi:transcriptional regulator with XRE-family HTH domain
MNIGEYIKQQREGRDWSLAQLSEKAGHISKGHLSMIERGQTDPSLSVLRSIARAFGMEAGDLLVAAGYTVNPKSTEPTTIVITIQGNASIVQRFPTSTESE